jgi:hypothetical protein
MPSREKFTSLVSYWKQRIDAWQASNQSQKAFCRAHDRDYHRFGYWRRKFLQQAGETQRQRGSDFVHASQAEASGLWLVLPNGRVLQGIATDSLPVGYQRLSRLSCAHIVGQQKTTLVLRGAK